MLFPAIKQNKLYSVQFSKDLDIMFEDFNAIDIANLGETIKTANYENIVIIPNVLSINTKNNTITIIGHRINNSTWLVTKAGKGKIYINNYSCSNDTIIEGIKYIYHILNSKANGN
jgi:hypothetical protein